jgi:hypothetical protein
VPDARTKRFGEEERICRPLNDVVIIGRGVVVTAGQAGRQRSFEGVEVGEEAFVVTFALPR